jgi:hypothetical protein
LTGTRGPGWNVAVTDESNFFVTVLATATVTDPTAMHTKTAIAITESFFIYVAP